MKKSINWINILIILGLFIFTNIVTKLFSNIFFRRKGVESPIPFHTKPEIEKPSFVVQEETQTEAEKEQEIEKRVQQRLFEVQEEKGNLIESHS